MKPHPQDLLDQLRIFSKTLDIEIIKLSHEPLSGGYLGHIRFEGIKDKFSILITFDLDFLEEVDGISMGINLLKDPSSEIIEVLKEKIIQMRNNFNSPYIDNWPEILSKEIKIKTAFYN